MIDNEQINFNINTWSHFPFSLFFGAMQNAEQIILNQPIILQITV